MIRVLGKRSGERCSNPSCSKPTSGPTENSNKFISIGVAAHISAASPGGPRYSAEMSTAQRKSIDNGIWLCQSCAKLIDSDTDRYTAEIISAWKLKAELRALQDISGATHSHHEKSETADEREDNTEFITIVLGENCEFFGGDGEIETIAKRCALASIEDREIRFEVILQPTKISSAPEDPLALPLYERGRRKMAENLSRWLAVLSASEIRKWWEYYLGTIEEWTIVLDSLLESSRIGFKANNNTKIDVWRTESPTLSAPIYLESEDLERALIHMGLSERNHLSLGAYWKSVPDLPHDLVVKHVIPRIVMEIARSDAAPSPTVINLMQWHIGLG